MPKVHDNDSIYRLVADLVECMDELKDETLGWRNEEYLLYRLGVALQNKSLGKDLQQLGGIGSSRMNDLLRGFVGSLKKAEPVSEIHAEPVFAVGVPVEDSRLSRRSGYPYESADIHCHRCRHACCRCSGSTDSFWFWMYLFNSGGTQHHHHYHDNAKKESTSEMIFGIIIFITVVMTILSAVIAAIYLFGQMADIIERLMHNEGSGYALFSLSVLGLSAAGSFLGAAAVLPLILLAAGASNPVGWSIFGVVCLGAVFTSLSHALLSNLPTMLADESFKATFASDGFVAKDFGRVQLTEAEEKHLRENTQLDPMKVNIAIALLRHEMGAGAVPSKYGNHALFSQSCRTQEQQQHLESIRALRAGDIMDRPEFKSNEIKVGNMIVKLTQSTGSAAPPLSYEEYVQQSSRHYV
ncbi:MAG: hypothetical protein P1U61_05275 [Legionellaceae bacterium]|nr:hypothetical protein [Legionellaceae bacterium]